MEKYMEGILSGSGRGFGFVKVEGFDDNFFVPPPKMMGALDGDKVLVERVAGAEPNVVAVKQILEFANQTIIGNLMYGLMGNYVVADNPRINKTVLINAKELGKATVGDKVVVRVTAQPASTDDLLGEIVEVLGSASQRSVLEKAIIRDNKIRDVFPDSVLSAASSLPQEVQPEDLQNRTNLTDRTICTIDGDDTRDIDDAISIQTLPNGNFLLGVHIADVGHYVPRGGVIDQEAYARGTSTYCPGYVIPMLPTALSNGICSLNEGVLRLTLNCDMEIDAAGQVVRHKIYEGYIKSCARLTYDKVKAALEGTCTEEKYVSLLPQFEQMKKLSDILQAKKNNEGYLEFDLPEAQFDINERGELVGIRKMDNHFVHQIIENFMVVANETVAEHFFRAKVPFIYRVHEVPTPEKSANLLAFMEGLGLDARLPESPTPKDYQKILNSIDGSPFEHAMNRVLLMSLQKARYHEKCLGHFGLASTYYTHFTSPIRRYPDLSIHRIIKDCLHGSVQKNDKHLKNFVESASLQSSETEKRSEVGSRQVEDLKMAEFMQSHIGERHTGTISGITNFGVFVELENTIEGMIRIENLPEDEYEFQEKTMRLVGHRHTYSYGDQINIIVARVDLPKRQIDFCEASTTFKEKERKELVRRPKLDKTKLPKSKIFKSNKKYKI